MLAVVAALFCAAAGPAGAQSRVPWTILSTTTGGLPPATGGSEQTSCVVADVDGDGAADFFITDRSVAPSVILYRRQAGGWQKCIVEAGRLAIEAGGDAADIDGDGDLDVAFGQDYSGGNVWWWENPGAALNPSTPWVRRLIKSGGSQQHDQRFGDFDGDGRLEFATWVNGSSVVEIYEIPVDRTVSPWTRVAVIAASGEGMDVADVDLDGKVDLLIGGHWIRHVSGTTYTKQVIDAAYNFARIMAGQFIPGGRPEILQNSGDGLGPLAFYSYDGSAWQKTVLISQVINGHTLEVGDFDRDGHLDFFAAEMGSPGAGVNCKAWIGYGDGAGQFSLELIRTGLCNHMSRVADLDGDGDLDIVMKPYTQGAPRVDVLLNGGTNSTLSLDTWTRHVIDSQKPWQAVFITAGDVNRDGWQDIVTGGWWYRNPGSPGGAWTRNTIGTPMNNLAALYDFDGDGDLDVLGTQGQGSATDARLVWAQNDGAGGFTIRNNVSAGQGDFLQGVAVAQFTSGGPLEVALSWHAGGQGVQMLTVPADPVVSPWPWRVVSAQSQDEQLTAGDIDRDGDLDLLLGTQWLRNDAAAWSLQALNSSGGMPDRNRLVDVNGDGRLDAVVGFEGVSATAKLVWYEQPVSPTDTWTEHLITNLIGPMSLDVADLDRDGDVDVVVGEHNLDDPASARLIILENLDGVGGSWQPHVVHTGDEHHDGAQLVDIDGDGDLDILSIGWGHSQVLLYENRAAQGSVAQVATPTITPNGGLFNDPVIVALQTDSSAAAIHYTLDGATPTTNSPRYTAPLPLAVSATVRARAFQSGLPDSAVASATFAIDSVPVGLPTNGMTMWLRADAGFTSDAATGTRWLDQSGNQRHANQTAVGDQPALVNSAANGLPAVRFDGVNDSLSFTLPISNLTGLTLVAVSANTQNQSGSVHPAHYAALFWDNTAPWGATYLSPLQQSAHFRFGTTQVDNRPLYNRPASVGSSFTLSTAIKDGTTDALYVNTVLAVSEGGKLTTLAGSQNTGNLGRGYQSTFFAGDIAEVLVYSRALTVAERQAVEQYLDNKYELAVPVAPQITSQPTDLVVAEPAVAMFATLAKGTAPLTYQWRRAGVPISGATNSGYALYPALAATDNGAQFDVVVGNALGSVTSLVATLTVNLSLHSPGITNQPANVAVLEPNAANFSVTATGTAPLAYQWRRAGVTISGATNSSYTLSPTSVAADNGAQFNVVVTNASGSVTSVVATLTVEPKLNSIPVPRNPGLWTVQDEPASLPLIELATDPDGDLMSFLVSSTSTNGGVVSHAGDTITYTPVAGFIGTDAFTYTVSDDRGGVTNGTVVAEVWSAEAASPGIVSPPAIVDGDFVVWFGGIPGRTYTIEWSASVIGPWTKAVNVTAPVTDAGFGLGVFEFREAVSGTPSRFFRAYYPSY